MRALRNLRERRALIYIYLINCHQKTGVLLFILKKKNKLPN